jgi:hypothetical protein
MRVRRLLLLVDVPSRHLSVINVCCLIFALSFAVRLIMGLPRLNELTTVELEKIVISLVTTGVFGNPYPLPTGPTAHAAPIYPSILAFLSWLFGAGTLDRWAQLLLNSFAVSLQYSLLPAIARTYGLPTRVGIWAGLIGALVPLFFWIEIWAFEAPFTGIALMVVSLLTLRSWQQREFSPRAAAVQGLCWGVALLVAPNLILVFLGLTLATFILFHNQLGLIMHSAVTICLMSIVLLPWTLRNYRELGGFVFIRSNFGLELSVSNNNFARAAMIDNFESGFSVGHPNVDYREATKVQQLGEIAYNRAKMHEALAWIRENPVKFIKLTALRMLYSWFPKMDRLSQTIVAGILTIAAAVGLCQLFRINSLAAALITTIWVSYPIIFYFLQFHTRYRYPLHWTFVILAAFAFDRALQGSSSVKRLRAATA